MEEEKVINLKMDGNLIGIGIYSYIEDCHLKSREGKKLLFRNVNQARIYAEQVKKITNPLDYELNIVIGLEDENGEIVDSIINYDIFDFVDGAYQMYADNGCIYNIKPAEKFIVPKLGYIVFNGNEKIDDPELGKQTNRQNFEDIKDAANAIITYPNKPYTISNIKRYYISMALGVKNTTATINILYNSQIMNINQNRKNAGLRSFQFDRNMDKFNTLYFYIQTDYYEPDYFRPKTIKRCVNTLNCLIAELNKKRPDATLNIIDPSNPIVINRIPIVKKEDKNDDTSSES